jgi:hypothetical protein
MLRRLKRIKSSAIAIGNADTRLHRDGDRCLVEATALANDHNSKFKIQNGMA